MKDLRHLKHIKSLHIEAPTENLGVLKDFANLRELYITNSNETDWSFIEDLTGLQSLYIINAQFNDLTPIASLCEKQYQKYIHSNEEEFCFLKNLYLNYCEIKDITPLKKCASIGELDLSHNHIRDISPLKNVKRLFTLTLRYNKIKDLSPLESLPNIHSINARHNDVSNIKVLLRFKSTNLTQLYLGDNPIKDYLPIKKIDIPLNKYKKRATEEGKLEAYVHKAKSADWMAEFVYNSLAIEGSELSHDDVKRIIHAQDKNNGPKKDIED